MTPDNPERADEGRRTECGVCLGFGEIPIPEMARAPGSPETLPCPFCHPELCHD